ncbi:MAG: CinA family protein, partial [Pirellulaceae bacterium]|nr:CinA family protein [Pirellulaceae bacterium]
MNSPAELESQLTDTCETCARLLSQTSNKLIFAESCTSGLLAASLSLIPGISNVFCGSYVTYRESLKTDALGVHRETLDQFTAVSRPTTLEMLSGCLDRCTEATVGLAITGHLGPDAPPELDGVVFIACMTRCDPKPIERQL